MILSIVTTLYRSEPTLRDFHRRASEAAFALVGAAYEIVIVNDGSPDGSLDIGLDIAMHDPRVRLIDLSRNFGHHRALMTGIGQAKGQFVFLIDSDLEEDPAWLADFAAQMQSEQCDVVYGVQSQRKGGAFERASGHAFYSAYRWLTGFKLPRNLLTVRLMTRRYVDALLQHDEREMFIAGLWLLTGFAQSPRTVKKESFSPTTYSVGKKFALVASSVASMSNRPLIGVFYLGLAVSVLSGLYIAILFLRWFWVSRPPDGWTSLIASVWLLGGLVLSCLGLVGIYLAKIFTEVKRRPYVIVRAIHQGGIFDGPEYSLLSNHGAQQKFASGGDKTHGA